MAAQYHSQICARAHTAMEELFGAGLLDPQGMHQFDLLCRSDAGEAAYVPRRRDPEIERSVVSQPSSSRRQKGADPLPAWTHAPRPGLAPQSAKSEFRRAAGTRPQSRNDPAFYATTAHAVAMTSKPVARANAYPRSSPVLAPAMQWERSPAELRGLRLREGVSEAVFARCLDVRPQAVIAWEAGLTKPGAHTLPLLAAIEAEGLGAVT